MVRTTPPTKLLINFLFVISAVFLATPLSAQRYMVYLDRGLIAVKTGDNSAFLSWRLLATDAYNLPFHPYRQYVGEEKMRPTDQTLMKETNFEVNHVNLSKDVM